MKINITQPQDRHSLFLAFSNTRGVASSTPIPGRRKITPEAGRGLEKLGHALDYLTDEFVVNGCSPSEYGTLEAIQLLASLRKQIYFACGVEPTIRERVHSLLRRF